MNTLSIVFYLLSTISIVATLSVIFQLKKGGIFSRSCKLLFLLQVTQLLEDLSSFPFYGTIRLCKFAAFIRNYSGLSNVIVGYLMTDTAKEFLFANDIMPKEFHEITANHLLLIFGFPLITLLPYISDSYGIIDSTWCSFKTDNYGNMWIFIVFLSWVWIFLLASVFILVKCICWSRMDPKVSTALFQSIGIYSVVTIVCWIPRSILRMGLQYALGNSQTYKIYIYVAVVLTYVCGILYAVIFYQERETLVAFEEFVCTYSLGVHSKNSDLESFMSFVEGRRSSSLFSSDQEYDSNDRDTDETHSLQSQLLDRDNSDIYSESSFS